MNHTSLAPLLLPESIAVVGASPKFGGVGGTVMHYLKKFGYQGKVYPINPKYGDILGWECFPSLVDIPGEVDCALLGIPAKLIKKTITDACSNNVKSAIITSSGFAELGPDGKRLQQEIVDIAREGDMRLCGPNCNGIVNFNSKATLCFSKFLDADQINTGNVGFVSQSGALGGAFVDRAQDRNLGFSYYIAPGNESDLEVVDFISFLIDDPNTSVIAAYVEQIRDGKKFARVARKATEKGKPIIVFKVGVTQTGAKAAASHTGALAGDDLVYNAFFKQNGVIRVNTYDDLIETTLAFSKSRLPRGNRVGIISSSGGGAIDLSDKSEICNLKIPPLTKKTKKELGELLPAFANLDNPVDLTWGAFRGGPEEEIEMFKCIAQDDNFDVIIFMMSMVAGERARMRAGTMVDTAKAVDKSFFAWWAPGNLAQPAYEVLDAEGSCISLFKSSERCITAIKAMVYYAKFQKQFKARNNQTELAIDTSIARKQTAGLLGGKDALTEFQSKSLLSCYDIPVSREKVARTEDQAVAYAKELYPVALKISSSQIAHKTEAGGIFLNLTDEQQVRDAYNQIIANAKNYNPDAQIDGVLVAEMVPDGTEIIVGLKKDPAFGMTLVFGLGGIFVEVLKDVSLRTLPITREDAFDMISEIRSYDLLKGVRGSNKADIDAIVDLLVKMSALGIDFQDDIDAIDLNPVIVFDEGKGVKVVDALFIKKA